MQKNVLRTPEWGLNSVALKAAQDTRVPRESATSQNYTNRTWKQLSILSLYCHIN